MIIADDIVVELDKILTQASGFERDGWFQINGHTEHLDISQNSLEGSLFSFDYRNKKILHFTNLNSALAIWGSKYIRSSQLSTLADPNELVHSLNLISQNHTKIDTLKEHTFVACFTPTVEGKPLLDYNYHWENYGNNNKGIALEFDIIRTPLYPNFYSLNVNYIESSEQNNLLKHLKNNVADFITLKALIPLLTAFKQPKFVPEEEIRIVTQYPRELFHIEDLADFNLDFQMDANNKFQYYVKLPFLFANENDNSDPLLKLRKVYFGHDSGLNDGRELINRFFIPECQKCDIRFEFLEM